MAYFENSMWNLTSPPLEDNLTIRSEWKEYRETNVNVKNLRVYELYNKDLDARLRTHMAVLDVRGKILKEDGTPISNGNTVALINNGFNLFNAAELSVANKVIERVEYPGLTTTVKNLVDFSDDYSKSVATNYMWFPDTSEHANKTRFEYPGAATKLETNAEIKSMVSSIIPHKQFNNGFLERWKLTRNGKQFSMWLPLSKLFGFCNDVDKILTGIQFTVKLWKNENEDMLHTPEDNKYTVQIDHVSLWIPNVTPELTTPARYEAQLSKMQNVDLKWESANCYKSDLRNDNEGTWRITTNQHAVSHVFIVFQDKDKLNNLKGNNMIFDHVLHERSHVRINGKQYPEEELETNFDPNSLEYSRAYNSFLNAGLKDIGCDLGTIVNYNTFAEIYPIFHYDVSKRESVITTQPQDVEFRWRLKNRAEYYIFAVVISEVDSTLNLVERKTFVIP